MANSSPQFKQEIQQMMYIAGETQDTSDETTTLIESIIHGQVVHMLTTANDLALRRGARLFTVADLIFQFRHNTPRVDRLRTFLTWKAIRKTVKDADDKDALAAADDEPDVDDGAGAGPLQGHFPPSEQTFVKFHQQTLSAATDAADDSRLVPNPCGPMPATTSLSLLIPVAVIDALPQNLNLLLDLDPEHQLVEPVARVITHHDPRIRRRPARPPLAGPGAPPRQRQQRRDERLLDVRKAELVRDLGNGAAQTIRELNLLVALELSLPEAAVRLALVDVGVREEVLPVEAGGAFL
ncbi:predicted protein [Verticillium alfalfae VaMs.102]|uniref:Predicted protein n=1 Tax=Verticillium alfalfae (strain VaMs.102 / ATCC MYA-4576 / FGSC 10136) TaxID=526221 RepID=C9SL00_VERA1|nr:predicted protein [Verticillium alfalfae VaMs.102]EEY19368.1 predicted protein [Verticillium alfalfae VaMs.102]